MTGVQQDWSGGAFPHVPHELKTSRGLTHVVAAGAGSGICIYLPGTNFNSASSTELLGVLASRCRVYAADLPGQPGLSAAERPRPELAAYAAWVAELIAWVRGRHQSERIVLAGHSRGAAVALSAKPDTVDGLALLAPAGLTAVRPSIGMLGSTLPWILRRDNAAARRLLEYMSGPAHAPADHLVEWMTLVARACRTTGAPGPLPDVTLKRWQGRPVRVGLGEHDVFFPVSKLREPCRTKLGLEPSVVPGAGHLLVDEESVIVSDLITSLL